MNLKISFVIANYNGYEISKDCISSLLETCKGKFEIILVDNASSDRSGEKLKKQFEKEKRVKFVLRKKNGYLVKAYNDGYDKSRGENLIFMNNDLVFERDWLEEIIEVLKKEDVGLVGCSACNFEKKEIVDNQGGKLNILGYGLRVGAGDKFSLDKKKYKEVFYIQGVLIAVKRSVFEELGGFDESFGLNYEDVDLSWRAKLAGYKNCTAMRSRIYHRVSWTMNKHMKDVKSAYFSRRNRMICLLKNASFIHLILIFLPFAVLQFVLFLKEIIIDSNWELAMQTPKAVKYISNNWEKIMKKRKNVKRLRSVSFC